MSILSKVPEQLRAGDTLRLLLALQDHDAPTWSSVLYFENSAGAFNVTGAASGTSHSFTVDAATTAGKAPGSYKWTIRATAAGVAETVDEGWIEILPNPASTTRTDPRGWARRTLEAIEAFLEGNATTAQASMTINGRSIARWSLQELLQWRDKLRAEVQTEEQGATNGLGRNIKVRF